MRFKVGEKVRIREKQYFQCLGFKTKLEEKIKSLPNGREVIIKEIKEGIYFLKEIPGWRWHERWLEEVKEIFEPIASRFEILDL